MSVKDVFTEEQYATLLLAVLAHFHTWTCFLQYHKGNKRRSKSTCGHSNFHNCYHFLDQVKRKLDVSRPCSLPFLLPPPLVIFQKLSILEWSIVICRHFISVKSRKPSNVTSAILNLPKRIMGRVTFTLACTLACFQTRQHSGTLRLIRRECWSGCESNPSLPLDKLVSY